HQKIAVWFREKGIQIQEFAYCFHKPEDDCNCRKPATGLITALAKSYELDLSRSYVIGDKWSDIQLAYRSQSTGVLLNSHYPPDKPAELQNVEVPWFKDWDACEKSIPPLHS
ncbi:HAD-IIIA family hydrolase, partial [bacterium]|nr:HAD-IIIA family hydrolase [bacterium]